MATQEDVIYTAETMKVDITDVTLNGVEITTGNPPTVFTYEVRDMLGVALSPPISGTVANVSGNDWRATFTAPPRPGRYHCHWTITQSTNNGFGHAEFEVHNRD
jgi:hypothetical protein